MTRIDNEGFQALAAIMRSQVQSLAKPLAAPIPVGAMGRNSKAGKRSKSEDLAARLARRARSIDPSDPDSHRQAMHVFLESVLLAEFGEHLINDPAFHQIVERVYEYMSSNEELLEMMSRAAGTLLSS